MTDLFEQSSMRLDTAINKIASAIADGGLSKKQLFDVMATLHGCGSAEGLWSQRGAYDLLEAALSRHLQRAHAGPDCQSISKLTGLIESLPTHTVRSEDQIRYQQMA